MVWGVEVTDEFKEWWDSLAEGQQDDVAAIVMLLEEHGPQLPFPYSSGIANSKHDHMRELRVQSSGKPVRGFYVLIQGGPRSC